MWFWSLLKLVSPLSPSLKNGQKMFRILAKSLGCSNIYNLWWSKPNLVSKGSRTHEDNSWVSIISFKSTVLYYGFRLILIRSKKREPYLKMVCEVLEPSWWEVPTTGLKTLQANFGIYGLLRSKKVILGTKFKRCVQHHELRATDCCFLGGFVQSNLSKPCAIPKLPLHDVMVLIGLSLLLFYVV